MDDPGTPTYCLEPKSTLRSVEDQLSELADRSAVFILWPESRNGVAGEPHLGRTALLRRRLSRLLRPRQGVSRLASLRDTVDRVECWLTGSKLESSLIHYSLARRIYPESYRERIRLRMPAYVKVLLENPFPRTAITTRLSSGGALFYGPFRSRAAAEKFEGECLNLFQVRRCQEDLEPSPDHPGCIYGEMSMCLRPCQQVTGPEEYRGEVGRLTQFLNTQGESLAAATRMARDRFSEEMLFEDAARQHKLLEKIEEVLRWRDELVSELDHLHGVAVSASVEPGAVDLRFVYRGFWQSVRRFVVSPPEQGRSISLDQRLRELAVAGSWETGTARTHQDHVALLARWGYSSWRDGEWLQFSSPDEIPWRKLVRSVSRVAAPSRT